MPKRWEDIAAVIIIILGVLAFIFAPPMPVFDPPSQPPPAATPR